MAKKTDKTKAKRGPNAQRLMVTMPFEVAAAKLVTTPKQKRQKKKIK